MIIDYTSEINLVSLSVSLDSKMSGRGAPRRTRGKRQKATAPYVRPTTEPGPLPQGEPQDQPWWEARDSDQQAPATTATAGHAVDTTPVDTGTLQQIMQRVDYLERCVAVKGDLIDNLSITVPPELKQKIIGGKFVELADLLTKSFKRSDDDKVAYTEDERGNLIPQKIRRKKADLTIELWTSAFHTFISVYVAAHPGELQDLLAYMELIRSAARDHPQSIAWRHYDEEFRSKREADPARPWGMIDNQLWLSHFCKPYDRTQTGQPHFSGEKKATQQGCFFFNSPYGCRRPRCPYTHLCSACNSRSHAATNCPTRPAPPRFGPALLSSDKPGHNLFRSGPKAK